MNTQKQLQGTVEVRDGSFIHEVVQMNGSFQRTKWTIQQNKKKYFIVHCMNYYWASNVRINAMCYKLQTNQSTNVQNMKMNQTTHKPTNVWTNECYELQTN